jgi:dihydroorotate dehydrogenase electron transfer subunit
MTASPYLESAVRTVMPAGTRGVVIELEACLQAEPGQFMMLWRPGVDEKPFSLVDVDPVTLAIVRVGPFTERMQSVQPGDRLYLRGPLGHGFSLVGQRPLLVAGGCGSAPLAYLSRRLRELGRPVSVALGARCASELLLQQRFHSQGVTVLACTEDGSCGERGLVTEAAGRALESGRYDRVYACGPSPMLERVEELCRIHGVPGELSWEAYMRCGIGVCGSCDRGTGLLVCKDGPVFPVRP